MNANYCFASSHEKSCAFQNVTIFVIFLVVTPIKCEVPREKMIVRGSQPPCSIKQRQLKQVGSVSTPSLQPRVILFVGRIAIVVGFPVSANVVVVGWRGGYTVHALQKLHAQTFRDVESLKRRKYNISAKG